MSYIRKGNLPKDVFLRKRKTPAEHYYLFRPRTNRSSCTVKYLKDFWEDYSADMYNSRYFEKGAPVLPVAFIQRA